MKILSLLLVISTVLFSSTVTFASEASENYYYVAEKTYSDLNHTTEIQGSIEKNGKKIISANVVEQHGDGNCYKSAYIYTTNQDYEYEKSVNDGEVIIHYNNDYYTDEHSNLDANALKMINHVMSIIITDKNSAFEQEGNTITVDLSEDEISKALNVAINTFVKLASSQDFSDGNIYEQVFNPNIFEEYGLNRNIKIESINMQAEISDEFIASNTIQIVITGEDENKNENKLEIFISIENSDFGTATPSTVSVPQSDI